MITEDQGRTVAAQSPLPIPPADVHAYRARVVWSDRVRLERLLRKWSQADLSRVAGVTQPQVSRIENGARNVSNDVLVRVARAFGIPAAELFPYADAIEQITGAPPAPRAG